MGGGRERACTNTKLPPPKLGLFFFFNFVQIKLLQQNGLDHRSEGVAEWYSLCLPCEALGYTEEPVYGVHLVTGLQGLVKYHVSQGFRSSSWWWQWVGSSLLPRLAPNNFPQGYATVHGKT